MGQESEIQFFVLGPLEAERGGRRVALGGRRQRAVLAALVLEANRAVPRDRLTYLVWGDSPPETAPSALQGYVSALRRLLGAETIATRSSGYALHAADGSVDLHRFEASAAAGAEALADGRADSAAEVLREGLSLWRGEPLADLADTDLVERERERLEERRLGALADRVDAELALGRHGVLIGDLRALVSEHPLRERFRGQLMLALYRSGRQAEALDVYRAGRELLANELGLEPSDALRQLERSILQHDKSIAAPRRARPSSQRWRRMRAGAAAGAAAAVAVALVVIVRSEPTASSTHVVPDSIAVVDPRARRVVADIKIAGRPAALASGPRGLYAVSERDGILWRIDTTTKRLIGRIGVGVHAHDAAVGFGSVWLADGADGTVTRVRDDLSRIQRKIIVGRAPTYWITATAGRVWVTSGSSVAAINPRTNRVVRRFAAAAPAGLAAGLGGAWVASGRRLTRLTPVAALPQAASPPEAVVAPVLGRKAAWWIVYNGFGEVWRVTPAGDVAIATGVGRFPLDLAVGEGAIWTIDTRGTIIRIDPGTTRPTDRIATAPTLRSALVTTAGYVWAAIEQPS